MNTSFVAAKHELAPQFIAQYSVPDYCVHDKMEFLQSKPWLFRTHDLVYISEKFYTKESRNIAFLSAFLYPTCAELYGSVSYYSFRSYKGQLSAGILELGVQLQLVESRLVLTMVS